MKFKIVIIPAFVGLLWFSPFTVVIAAPQISNEIITFKGISLDTPGVKNAVIKLCQEDESNRSHDIGSYHVEDKCTGGFEKSNAIWLSYGILGEALGRITLGRDDSLVKVEIFGSKGEMQTQAGLLETKYGQPVKLVTQVENKMGTKFDKETFIWIDSRGSRITVETMYNKIDDGRIIIESASTVALEKVTEKLLIEAGKNNL
jgi:hypothetical protein